MEGLSSRKEGVRLLALQQLGTIFFGSKFASGKRKPIRYKNDVVSACLMRNRLVERHEGHSIVRFSNLCAFELVSRSLSPEWPDIFPSNLTKYSGLQLAVRGGPGRLSRAAALLDSIWVAIICVNPIVKP